MSLCQFSGNSTFTVRHCSFPSMLSLSATLEAIMRKSQTRSSFNTVSGFSFPKLLELRPIFSSAIFIRVFVFVCFCFSYLESLRISLSIRSRAILAGMLSPSLAMAVSISTSQAEIFSACLTSERPLASRLRMGAVLNTVVPFSAVTISPAHSPETPRSNAVNTDFMIWNVPLFACTGKI